MTAKPRFLLDANVFIEAKQRYYAFDICPGFWEWLKASHGEGKVLSIDRVRTELEQGKDELWMWVEKRLPKDCFAPTDGAATIAHFQKMVTWVQGEAQYKPQAKADFAAKADGWLAAHAKAHGLTVITHEEWAADAKKKVPLPNVCRKFGVPHANTFDMLRALAAKFDLR